MTGFFDMFSSEPQIKIERAEMDFGRDVFGDKISIRDNIKVTQTGQYKLDGNLLGLGNERKQITINFLTELGYFIDDIKGSERIDTIIDGQLKNRTLKVTLPLPDTLAFIEMRQDIKKNEWFWEGWYKDNKNYEARRKFLAEMKGAAYRDFYFRQIDPDRSSSLEEASQSILNYVNNGYKIANEQGFDQIITTFQLPDGTELEVRCNSEGNCFRNKMIERKSLG